MVSVTTVSYLGILYQFPKRDMIYDVIRLMFQAALPCIIAPAFATVFLLYPLLLEASRWRRERVESADWNSLIAEVQHSPDAVERESLYMGQVAADGSPLLVPRNIFKEHAHFLGDSGSGKTSIGLAPLIHQLIQFGDSSVIYIDLKADSMEPYATLAAAIELYRQSSGVAFPLKHFTLQPGVATYAFNPLTQPCWNTFDTRTKSEILCFAFGLVYGTDYGKGFFSSANASLLHNAIKENPGAASFRELYEAVARIVNAKRHSMPSDLRQAGSHSLAILEQLSSFHALNVPPNFTPAVVQRAIDLGDVFRRPQAMYFHLSAMTSSMASPLASRIAINMLLAAASQVAQRHHVYLIIDEFQRIVASNVEALMQMARSYGVSVILANQSMQDLKTLISAVESNCRYRQWFAVSGLEDRERLTRMSGVTVDLLTTAGSGMNSAVSLLEQIVSRLTTNDIALASDHPLQSVVQITRGDGYAQYGGFPFVVESTYHIDANEYRRRKAMRWPEGLPGTYIPPLEFEVETSSASGSPRPGSLLTSEAVDDMFPPDESDEGEQ